MAQNPNDSSDQINALVFKDNFAARNFQIPLRWITRFGLILGLTAGTTLIAIALALKFYITSRHSSPARVQDLERELSTLRSEYQNLEGRLAAVAITQPSPGVSGTPIAPLAATPPTTQFLPGKPLLFSALPLDKGTPPPDRGTLPFTLNQPKVFWRGNSLILRTNIQYIRGDGGNQQGHIVILARGNEMLWAYPEGVLSMNEGDSLIHPEQGEYFSVSRFREIQVEFSPVPHRGLLQEVEVLIFGPNHELLLLERIPTPKQAPGPIQKPEVQ